MNYPVNINSLPAGLEYSDEVSECMDKAERYLSKHRWCSKINNGWLFTYLGYVLCIFVFEIENLQSPEDNLVWVMSGDFPSIYLDTYNVKTTKEVVEVYIDLAEQWIKAATYEKSLDDCYPFEVDKDLIALFKNKTDLLKTKILNHIEEIPFDSHF